MHLDGLYRCLCYISLLFLQELHFVKADIDVALNQQASSSSNYTWNNGVPQFSSPSFAVNGLNNQQTVTNNTNSGAGYYPRVCSVTLQEAGLGWWMVNLGATYHITSIKIFGVPDDSVVNQSGFFDIFVMQSVSDPSPVNVGGLDAPLNNPYVFTQATDTTGSVVRIEKNGNAPTSIENNILALCTVSVFGYLPSTTTTTTSTTTTATPTTTTTTPTTTITTPTTTITTPITTTTTPTTPTIPSTTTPPITTTPSSGSDQPSTTSASPATITTMSVNGSSTTPATTSGITPGVVGGEGLSTGAIIGIAVGVGGGVLLIIIIIIIVICCRRCKSKQHHEKNGTLTKPVAQPNHFNYDTKIATVTEMPKSYSNNALTAVPTDIEMDVADDDGEGVALTENDAYSSLLSPVKGVDIAVNCLPSYVKNELNMEDPLLEEFRKIPPKQATSPITAAYKQANIEKNRYKNIVPYDYNRVQLAKQEGNIHSDYISASFIPGYKGVQNYYIACQGPKFQTVGDFWRMIYEYKCNRIVMITRLVENGKKKCEQYYGDERGHIVHQGDFKIETKSTDRYADFTIRTLQVTRTGNSNALTVRQFHYERWFDKETPEDTFSVLQFRHKIRSYDNIATGPMVVHCSAGVGRSGTFIALDILLEQVKHDDEVNVVKCVMELRQQRMYMIQTVDQYRFLHLILAEAVETGDVAIPVPRFFDSLSTMRSTSGEAGHSAIERQFMVLNSLKKDITPSDIGQNYENMSKNRDETLIPADDHRVSLTIPFPSLTTYINAVFLQGYRRRDSYIATQHPLPHTVIDFWSMVAAQRCHTIVSLVDNSAGDPSHATYLPPDNSSTVYGPVQVMCSGVVGSETRAGFVVKELHLSHSEKRYAGYMEPAILYHFQVKGWSPDSDLPPDHTAIMDLIAAVRRWQLRNEDSPIVIHCSDGVRQSCYLFAACRMVEQTSANNEVDVFTAVRSAHVVRPQAIASLKQYDSLYELASIYLTRDIGVEYSNT